MTDAIHDPEEFAQERSSVIATLGGAPSSRDHYRRLTFQFPQIYDTGASGSVLTQAMTHLGICIS
jgi:hypothetical protein